MKTPFDPECYRLAEYFLSDCGVPGRLATEQDAMELARCIQQSVEDFFDDRETEAQAAADPANGRWEK